MIRNVTSFFAKLDDRATIELSGPDAKRFLQGQTTCDIDTLQPNRSLVGAYCTPQGRMVCDFRLLEHQPERLLMLLPADVVDAALATFSKYIVFSRAEIHDRSERWCQLAVWGAGALDAVDAPSREPGFSWSQRDVLWTVADNADAAETCLPADQADELMATLGGTLERVDCADYRRHEIECGIGHVRGATVEMFLPQMLNFQHTGRVSFSKGCYTGQEVVARMHYRGKTKRAMFIAQTANASAQPGDPLYVAGRSQTVGNVVSAELDRDGALKLLVVLALDARSDSVRLGEQGPELTFLPMPYPLDV
jgi:folate-binding protein YgfZ